MDQQVILDILLHDKTEETKESVQQSILDMVRKFDSNVRQGRTGPLSIDDILANNNAFTTIFTDASELANDLIVKEDTKE
jgi:hypothetical protein